jgi:glycosyltransferase involved in cell wall biosynthesis
MEGCKEVAVALCFKDFAFWSGYSSVGLNVAAVKTAEELRSHGIHVDVVGVKDNVELFNQICYIDAKRKEHGHGPLTHIVILAPWITPLDLQALIKWFPNKEFTVKSHCNVAALYGDYRGIGNFRNYADLMNDFPNLTISGNSESFVSWFSEAYGVNTFLLPDLYPVDYVNRDETTHRPHLRFASFGALRPEKNIPSAVAAGILIQQRLQTEVSFHINIGGETKGKEIIHTIDEMSQGIPGFTVVKHKWMPWSDFVRLVRTMDLLFQPSFTESFNIVTADGVSVGVPSVVSSAVRWVPDSWKANPDSPNDLADTGIALLEDPEAWREGHHALRHHNSKGVRLWKNYLYDIEPEEERVIPISEPLSRTSAWKSLVDGIKTLFGL